MSNAICLINASCYMELLSSAPTSETLGFWMNLFKDLFSPQNLEQILVRSTTVPLEEMGLGSKTALKFCKLKN